MGRQEVCASTKFSNYDTLEDPTPGGSNLKIRGAEETVLNLVREIRHQVLNLVPTDGVAIRIVLNLYAVRTRHYGTKFKLVLKYRTALGIPAANHPG
eukprot:SAG31_NODE_1917_length_6923_cov_8.914897_4_plen_97_part_00